MTRSRIVLETSNKRKTEMIEAASLQGTTLVDWLEENVTSVIQNSTNSLVDPQLEVEHVDELDNVEHTFKMLSSLDWSFTDDDTRYLTHDLHPYPAKFIPQIPTNLIAQLSMRGDVILDPFGGSATTAVETVRLGRRAISFDANPLSALIGRVKTGYMSSQDRADIGQLLAAVEGHIIGTREHQNLQLNQVFTHNQNFLPNIPNVEKWFSDFVIEELCLLRYLIDQTTEGLAHDAAQLALSRIIIRVSSQESETRYVSVKKKSYPTLTLQAYLESLKTVVRRLEVAATKLQYADARFLVGDSRSELIEKVGENTVDLIVTSPPYPNATDYHLYHRFRLFWLGFDPKELGRVEIGSHLRHQKNKTGFEEYRTDMKQVIEGCAKVLMPGRYSVFVVGDAIFKGELYSTSDAICEIAHNVGLEVIGSIDRPIHQSKRSFAKPARRARSEQLVILRKPNHPTILFLNPPTYRMKVYEQELRAKEINTLLGVNIDKSQALEAVKVQLQQPALWQTRRLTFTKDYTIETQKTKLQPTWQNILEIGDSNPNKRKNPKYATHGIHPFKGKFYPQLAKSLLNNSGIPVGGRIFDPFCGSGTTLLEGMLNGFAAYGSDINPLASKIASAKTLILCTPRDLVDSSIKAMMDRLSHPRWKNLQSLDQFPEETHDELISWFSEDVLFKLNWLLSQVRLFGEPVIVNFFEVIISSFIRDISDQDPSDLRIRRRKDPLEDAPVLEIFRDKLEQQHTRLEKYWLVAGKQPSQSIPPIVIHGDSRQPETLRALTLHSNSVDCVLTSPPYATALPYIDTDRLSLLTILGITSQLRSTLEKQLTGSREIRQRAKNEAEIRLLDHSATDYLPIEVLDAIRSIYKANKSIDVGFRRANMPSLLWRYYLDMKENLLQVYKVLRHGAKAYYVIGDSRTKAGGSWVKIETCKNIRQIGEMIGFRCVDSIEIDVTLAKYRHMKNSITKNQVVVFEKY